MKLAAFLLFLSLGVFIIAWYNEDTRLWVHGGIIGFQAQAFIYTIKRRKRKPG